MAVRRLSRVGGGRLREPVTSGEGDVNSVSDGVIESVT